MDTTITPQQLQDLRKQGQSIDLIDVRTPVEFATVHAEGARNIPLSDLDPASVCQQRTANPESPIYVICKSGARASKAYQQFKAAGVNNVVNVVGGTDHWVAEGLPVVRGRKSISLERQVRISAGAIVLIGALLALLVHPFWAGVPAFIGAGLIFAGVTDWCGMGLLLARMPWNRVPAQTTQSGTPSCSIS